QSNLAQLSAHASTGYSGHLYVSPSALSYAQSNVPILGVDDAGLSFGVGADPIITAPTVSWSAPNPADPLGPPITRHATPRLQVGVEGALVYGTVGDGVFPSYDSFKVDRYGEGYVQNVTDTTLYKLWDSNADLVRDKTKLHVDGSITHNGNVWFRSDGVLERSNSKFFATGQMSFSNATLLNADGSVKLAGWFGVTSNGFNSNGAFYAPGIFQSNGTANQLYTACNLGLGANAVALGYPLTVSGPSRFGSVSSTAVHVTNREIKMIGQCNFSIWNSNSMFSINSSWTDNTLNVYSSNLMTITPAGLVGINTSNPGSRLHVNGSMTACNVSASNVTSCNILALTTDSVWGSNPAAWASNASVFSSNASVIGSNAGVFSSN
ncbi:MAG: hypothetical protein ACRER5_13495, partial [Pseudomonas sp.]